MPKNWRAREKKLEKQRNGMKVSNRSIFTMDEANAKRDRKKVERVEKMNRKDGRDA